jgi:hypothetical protein
MRTNFLYIILALAVLTGAATTGCKKLTEGLNTNPNKPTSAPYQLVLNGAQVSAILVYEGNLARVAGIFSRSFTGVDRQYVDINRYNSTAGDYNDTWDNLYSIVIGQLKIVDEASTAVNDKSTVGISQVMLAQAFGLAADLWGDVPFSQAGDAARYPTPKFDTQADVYKGVQALLDSAIANLQAHVGNGPADKDIYFQGDRDKWIAVAYTLKARYFLHAKDYVNAIANAQNGIADASNNMMDPHGTSITADLNIFYDFLYNQRVGYMNAQGAYAPSLLDPTSATYRGNAKTDETARYEYLYQLGLITTDLDPNVLSNFDGWGNPQNQDGFFAGDTWFPLVTFQENQLILAEALIKNSSPDDASALQALNKHRQYMAIGGYINTGYLPDGHKYDDYVLADFSPGGMVNPASSGLTQEQALLKEILEEKYITLVGQIEQFSDVRRTKNLLGIPPTTGTKLPQRFLYPQDEINTNPNTPQLAAGDLFKETTANSSAY